MEPLTQHLPTDRSAPRLWFERLAIFSEPGDEHIIRSVPLRRGLNIRWTCNSRDRLVMRRLSLSTTATCSMSAIS